MLNQHLPNQGFIFTDQIKNEPKLFGQSKIRNILKFRINKVSIFSSPKRKKQKKKKKKKKKKKTKLIYLELTKGKDLAPATNRKMPLLLLCAMHMIT